MADDLGSLTVPADLDGVGRIRSFLRTGLDRLALGDDDAFRIELSLHEICVNIVMNAYPGDRGDMTVSLRREAGGRLVLEIRDRGVPFDPGGAPSPNLEEHVRAGRRAGLGIFLFRTMMDGFDYRREDGWNVLTVYKDVGALP